MSKRAWKAPFRFRDDVEAVRKDSGAMLHLREQPCGLLSSAERPLVRCSPVDAEVREHHGGGGGPSAGWPKRFIMWGGAVNRQPGYRARNLQRRGFARAESLPDYSRIDLHTS